MESEKKKWCEFIPVEGREGEYFCQNCDPDCQRPEASPSFRLVRRCRPFPVETRRSYLALGMTYAQAIARHVLYGATCTPQEIEQRYTICSLNLCGYFRQSHCAHPECGCRISTEPKPLLNKLAMASEQCPDKPPRWLRIKS